MVETIERMGKGKEESGKSRGEDWSRNPKNLGSKIWGKSVK